MRAFIALELSPRFADDAAELAHRLGKRVPGRFYGADMMHITLAFLGNIDQGGVSKAIAAIDDACDTMGLREGLGEGPLPVPLSCTGLGTFGRSHDATLWLAADGGERLESLARAVRGGLGLRGVDFDGKAFLPHITLGRRVSLPRGELGDLPFPERGCAAAVTLFKSELSATGPAYKPLYWRDLPPCE